MGQQNFAERKKLTVTELSDLRGLVEAYFEMTFFVPCRNEEAAIRQTLEKIKKVSSELKLSYEILVYDDASTDRTRGIVREFARENPDVPLRMVERLKRKGLGYNYIAGAYEGFGQHYMMVCGDDSETEESLRLLLSLRDQADMIIPYFKDLDSRNLFRRKLSQLFTSIVNALGGFKLNYYNGTVVHRRLNVSRWAPTSSGFAYQADLLTILLGEGKSFKELKIDNNDREVGFSRAFTVLNFLSVTHTLLQIFLRRIRRQIWPD